MSFSAQFDHSDDDAAPPSQWPSVGAGPLTTTPTTQTTAPTAPGDQDYVGSSDPNDIDLVTDTEYKEYADNSSNMASNDSNKPTPFTGDWCYNACLRVHLFSYSIHLVTHLHESFLSFLLTYRRPITFLIRHHHTITHSLWSAYCTSFHHADDSQLDTNDLSFTYLYLSFGPCALGRLLYIVAQMKLRTSSWP